MSDKDTESILESWLFRTTGAAWILAFQVVGVAVLAIAEQHIPKKGLLTVIGAQVLLLAAAILIARRHAKLATKRENELKSDIASLEKDLQRYTTPKAPAQDGPLHAHAFQVLAFLMGKPDGAYSIHIAHEVRLTVPEVEIAIDRLRDRKFIKQIKAGRAGPEYGTTPDGRSHYAKITEAQQAAAQQRR
jgi:DNA-binding MarR family transcriptional regulator